MTTDIPPFDASNGCSQIRTAVTALFAGTTDSCTVCEGLSIEHSDDNRVCFCIAGKNKNRIYYELTSALNVIGPESYFLSPMGKYKDTCDRVRRVFASPDHDQWRSIDYPVAFSDDQTIYKHATESYELISREAGPARNRRKFTMESVFSLNVSFGKYLITVYPNGHYSVGPIVRSLALVIDVALNRGHVLHMVVPHGHDTETSVLDVLGIRRCDDLCLQKHRGMFARRKHKFIQRYFPAYTVTHVTTTKNLWRFNIKNPKRCNPVCITDATDHYICMAEDDELPEKGHRKYDPYQYPNGILLELNLD